MDTQFYSLYTYEIVFYSLIQRYKMRKLHYPLRLSNIACYTLTFLKFDLQLLVSKLAKLLTYQDNRISTYCEFLYCDIPFILFTKNRSFNFKILPCNERRPYTY